MEKLINLLNEYCGEDEWSETKWTKKHLLEWWLLSLQLISKEYWFIKWLVENDKIDLWKIKKLYRKSNEHSIHTYPIMYEYSDLESLLMLLSISSSPIEDLISYLK